MLKEKYNKLVKDFEELSPTAKGFIIVGIILIIGIIFRWDYICSEVARGFNFFSAK